MFSPKGTNNSAYCVGFLVPHAKLKQSFFSLFYVFQPIIGLFNKISSKLKIWHDDNSDGDLPGLGIFELLLSHPLYIYRGIYFNNKEILMRLGNLTIIFLGKCFIIVPVTRPRPEPYWGWCFLIYTCILLLGLWTGIDGFLHFLRTCTFFYSHCICCLNVFHIFSDCFGFVWILFSPSRYVFLYLTMGVCYESFNFPYRHRE